MTVATYPLVEVRAYRKPREFEVDAQKRLVAGWTLQGQSGDSGHVGLGGAAAGYLVAGLPGMIGVQGMRKGKTVVTWIHPSPTALQIKACEARRRGTSAAANVWSMVALISFFAGFVLPPLFILMLVALCVLIGVGRRDNTLKQRY